MKHFLSLERLDVGRTLALTVGSPSVHRRVTMLRLLSVLVLIFTFGIGQMWGAEEVYKTATFTASNCTNNSNYTGSVTCTVGTDSWTATNAANNNGGWDYIKLGKKSQSSNQTTQITTSAAYTDAVTKVVLTTTAINKSYVSSMKLQVASNSDFSSNLQEISITVPSSAGAHTFTVTTPTANRYYRLVIVHKNTSSSNGAAMSITKVEYYHEAATGGHSITYNCDGADSGCPSNATNQTTLPNPLPDAPEKDGYSFDAWYTNSAKTTPAVAGAALSADITLYAKWVAEVCHETTTIFYPKQGAKPSAGTYNYKGVVTKNNSTNTNNSDASSLNGQTFTSCNGTQISFSHTSGTSYNTIWYASSVYDIRLYQNNPVTFTAPSGYIVKSVSKTVGASTTNLTTDNTTSTYTYTKSGSGGEAVKYFTVVVEATCTELGSINGSVSWSNGEATVSFADLADVNGWGLKYKKSSEENWSTYAGGFADENGIRSNSTAISGLEAGSQYDFKVTGSYSGSTYCTGAFEAALSPSSSSYVPQMGDPSVPSITDLGYIVGAQTSDAQSFTISASRLIGNLTVTAPDKFQVSTTSGTTGFGSSATLTPTSGSLTNAEVWVRLVTSLAENTYGGNSTYVTITGGGAAGKQVAVTGIVGASCHTPSISGSLSDATYNLNAEANALTITATKGDNSDPDLTYQWLQCTSSDGTYVNAVGGTGATTNSYTPPTTTAGSDLYYKCKVNSGTCFDYSGIARIQVNTPTITIGDNKTSHAFGDKGFGSENSVTISVSGANLAKDQNIGLALSGAGVSAYAIDKTSITASNGTVSATDVTITYTAAAGLSEATLTISSAGAVSKEIALSGTGKYQATFIANGNSESILVDGEGKLVLPTSTPSSCNGTYSTFIGWYSTAAGSNGDPTTDITECGTKAVTTHVLEGNETYYAVWGNGALSADEVKQVTLDFTDNSEWGFPTAYETESASYTQKGVTITLANAGDGWKFDSSNKYFIFGSANSTMTFPAFSFDVSKIVVTGRSGASSKTEQNIFVGETGVSIGTTGVTGTNTYVINSNYREAGTIYVLKITSAHKSQVTSIEIYSPGVGATAFISTCCTKHSITLDNKIANGSIESTETSACEGTSVTLTATATPNAGRFKSWDITDLDSYSTTTNPLTFDMPDNDITVSATFDALYAITKVEEGGTITLGANYAAENDVVTISAVAKQDYEEPRVLKVYKTNDESTEIIITNGQFTMPGYPVTAKVTYKPSKTPLPAPKMGANSNLTYNSVQLNWTNVANNSGYVLTIMQGEDVVAGYDAKAIDKDATSAVISGLEHLTDYTYTLYAKGDGITYVAVNTAANGGFTTLDYPTVTLYYSENGELSAGVDQQILTDFTLPSTALNGCTQKELVGWTTAANAEYSHDTDAPAGMLLPGATWQIPTNANCTLYAVYAKVTPEVVSWDATAITNIETSDIFVIVGNNGSNYALPNDGGASSPTVAAVTIANNKLSAAPAANLQWNLSGNASGYTFYPNGSTTTWLYCTNTNNGVKVGTGDAKAFTIKSGYLYTSQTTEDRYVGIYNSQDWRCYTSINDNIKDQNFKFYKKNVTPASTTKYATQCMAQVAKPSITGVTDGDTYEENKTVTITCGTSDATIYYSIDGQDPATEYTEPFTLSDNGEYIIRAYATKSGMIDSDEATAVSFSLDLPFTTIASFIAATPTNKKLVFTAESNARVLAYNRNRIYIQDGTGAMYLYNTGPNNEGHGKTWASGKKIVGTLTGTYSLTNNMPRMTVTDFGATNVTEDAIELPTPIAVEALATNFASNVCKLVTINGVSIRSESVADNNTINMTKSDVTYNIYNAFNALTGHKLPLGTTSCTVTGILGQSNSGTTLQLMPISADGISTNGAEAVLPVLSVTGSTNSAEPFEVATNKVITFTPNSNFDAVYAINDGEEAAVGNSTNVTITDEVNATKVYIKATREYYTDKKVTYYYLANPALIEYDITKSSMSHGSATIQNAQGDAITYAVGGATVTLVANPAEHYHWVSWEVTAGGEPVTVTNNTFEMPNAAVTVSATFEEDDYATVAFAKGNASVTGDAPASQKVYVGENATMPGKGSMILSSHNFAGWKLGSNAVLNTGDTYTVTAADHEAGTITFEAQWEPYPWASAGKWELVTSASEITVNPTTYVIFADTLSSGNTACGLTQNNNNRATVSVTKTDNLLTWTGADPAIFIVEEGKDEGTFAFYDAINNNYIHAASNSNNYLKSNTDKNTNGAAWTIDAIRSNGGATVTADTYTHKLLNLNGNVCAAYTAPQKGLAIYKFVGGSYYNIVYAKGTEDVVRNMPEGHVTDENGEAAIKENTPIRVGYTFTGWKDQDENVYTYNDGQIYAFTKNVTLTAQWEEQTDKYTVSYDANGSSDAVPAEAAYFENAEVTVADAVSKEGFVFMGWECNGRVYTAGSKFYMPATDMPMVAKYAHGATYDNMTKVNNVYSIESHDAPEGSEAVFTNSYTTAKQITKNNSMTLTLSGYTGYTIEGVKLSTGSNSNSGQGTLSITIGGVEVATDANADKWYNGAHYYGSNNGADFENVLVSMNPKTVKYGEYIDITIAASENSLYCQSFTILYDLLPVEVENTTTIEARDLAAGTEVIIHDGGTLNVNDNKTLDNLIIEAGGKVSGSETLIVQDLTIKTSLGTISGDDNDGGKSGEISNSNITANGDVWIEIELTQASEASWGWYAFSVPFPVNTMNGVYYQNTPLQNEVGYAIMAYHEDERAAGKYAWKKYRETNLVPGMLYIITVGDTDYKTLRFKKAQGTNLIASNSVPVSYTTASGEGASGWNGVGNPNLQVSHQNDYSYLQFLDHDDNCFRPRTAATTDLLVGTAFMVQVAESTENITIATGANEGDGNIALAPAREPKAIENTIFEVKLRNTNTGKTEDNFFFTAREDATNEYEIGRDVAKMSMGTAKCAQMWVPAYGTQLCAADFPLVNDKATYPLAINAPSAGTYTISTTATENATLYLTKNGRIYWNLTMGACELDLNQGQNNEYGLVLRADAPQVTTGIENGELLNGENGVQKVVIDEHVYILRGGEMYDMTGKMVK